MITPEIINTVAIIATAIFIICLFTLYEEGED